MQDKKSIKLTIIGLAVLFALILGATYAYLQAVITNDNSETLILGKTDKLGTVTLSNPTSDLKLKVTAKDMLKNKLGIYYATTDQALNYDAEEIQRNVALATLFGGESSLNYKCSMTVNIVTEGTMLSFLDEGDIYVQFGGLLTNKVDLTNISSEGYTVDFNLNNTYLPEQYVSASVALVNKNTNQNDLAGKSLAISFQNTNFSCEVIEATNETVNTSNSVIALQNSYGMDLMDYKIYGNSIQNGTPTPTNPVEVESVGDRTNNLFDFANLILKGNATTTKNSVTLPDNSAIYNSQEIIIQADSNTIYTLYGIIETKNSSGHIAIDCLDENKTTIKTNIIVYNAEDNKKFKTITTPANTKYLRVNLRNRTTDGFTMKDIMIAKGGVSHFEPVGYKIPIISKGKNLFDVQDGGTSANWSSVSYKYYPIYVGEGNTVTVSHATTNELGLGFYCVVGYKEEHKGLSQGDWLYHSTAQSLIRTEVTVTPTGTDYIYLNCAGTPAAIDQYLLRDDFQVEYGSSKTSYEQGPITTNIYLDEPLRKVGNTSDYIDFANKKVIRTIAERELIGTENWVDSFGTAQTYTHIVDKKWGNNLISNYFVTRNNSLTNTNYIEGRGNNTAVVFKLDNSVATSIDSWISWLQTKNNSGIPLTVHYELASAKEETINLPDIPTFEGTTTIEIGTTVAPSNVDIIYNKDLSK